VLHHVCEGCDPEGYSTSPSVFSAFLAWLAPRSSTGTYVRTMRDVASDTTAPVSSIACNGSACASTAYTAPVDVSLSATDAGSGVDVIRYTVDGSDPTPRALLQRPVHRLDDDYGQLPRLGHCRQRRGDEDPADPDGHGRADGRYYVTGERSYRERKHQGRCLARQKTALPIPTCVLQPGPLGLQEAAIKEGRADAKKVDRALDELLVSRLSTRPTDLAAEPGTNSGIASVAFYLDGTRLGTVTSAP
jgi:hypothetical protein